MIPKNIETLCKQNGTNFHALEKALGFGTGTISKWNASSPTVEKLSAVANYFGVTVDDLLADKEGA